jgi:hypothetical protein
VSALTGERTLSPARSAAAGRWDRLRCLLLLVTLVLVVGVVLTGERAATWDELRGRVAAGEVTRVVVRGELPAGGTGFSTVEIAWREGSFRRYAEVLHVRGDATHARADLPRTRVTPSSRLQEIAPDLMVVRHPWARNGGEVLGWRITPALQVGLVLVWFLAMLLLVAAPRTWRATPLAWFWLLLTPVGVPAFLLLAGPTPGLPGPRDPLRRLTGGWAFVVLVVLLAATAAG